MMRLKFLRLQPDEKGFLLPAMLSFLIAMGILSGAVLEVVLNNLTISERNVQSQQAFNMAEAGANYYLWHLSHNATDFKDGKTTPATPDATLGYGPYVHNYVDPNAVTEGTYTLWIKPQTGSTIATVTSIGQAKNSSIKRTVQAQIGAPSFASYAVVSDSALWFGSTESADGPVHSNQGVRMDGSSNAVISSANITYTPSRANGGCSSSNCSHNGVWCDPTADLDCNTRDKSDWLYNPPQTSVDFNQVSSSLCTMKKVATNNNAANACSLTPSTRTGSYIPQQGTFSTTKGYLIILNGDNTYDLYKVNNEDDTKANYVSALSVAASGASKTLIQAGIAIPSSGVIFVEDNVWLVGNGNFNSRLTIASGRLATNTVTDIVIAGGIKYASKNGSNALGLVAEDSIILAPYAPPSSGAFNFEVDAALLAQTGDVLFPNAYRINGNPTPLWSSANQQFLFYGSIATRQTWTWTWCSGTPCTTTAGIAHNTTQYDYNLQYSPPPSYPVTGGYNILSWREVLTKP